MNDDLRDLYQEVILDHGRFPRNFRHPVDANRQAEGSNPLCGDRIRVLLTVDADDVIQDAAFQGRGCAVSMASASLMTEVLRGKSVGQAKALSDGVQVLATTGGNTQIPFGFEADMDRLSVLSSVRDYPARVKCATLAWHTMLAALAGQLQTSME